MQTTSFSAIVQHFDWNQVFKIIFSNPMSKTVPWKKVRLDKQGEYWQVSQFTATQVFHENLKQLNLTMLAELAEDFRQIHIEFRDGSPAQILHNKKGTYHVSQNRKRSTNPSPKTNDSSRTSTSGHNRQKNYLIPENTVVAPLIDMGVMDENGRVFPSKYDKFKQINRFLELIDDAFKKQEIAATATKPLHIVDFGCGKAYLTFVLYYYFQEIRHLPIQITGLDLKKDVIEHCNQAAQKYGYTHLHFAVGDINGYRPQDPVDMVITLHACDTATDYALYNAVTWGARYIFSVPCCQHEINTQIQTNDLALLTRYGIIKERLSTLLTDALRANLLAAHGYQTQVVEFVDLEHTPKNIMLRAIKQDLPAKFTKMRRSFYLQEVENCLSTFQLKPCLYRLLEENN